MSTRLLDIAKWLEARERVRVHEPGSSRVSDGGRSAQPWTNRGKIGLAAGQTAPYIGIERPRLAARPGTVGMRGIQKMENKKC
jgi:hypothetical protein